VINKIMKEKKIVIPLIGVLVIVLIMVLIVVFKDEQLLSVTNPDGIKFADEYESLNNQEVEEGKKYPKVQIPNDNVIKYASVKDVNDVFKTNGDAVIYFGYSTCLYCRNAIQVLVDKSHESDLDVLYYIDIEEVWDKYELDANNKVVKTKEANADYYEMLDLLGDELTYDYKLTTSDNKEIATGVKRIEVPLVIFITNGQISSYNKGTLFSQEDPFVEMDDSQKQGLGEIYYYGIRDVVNAKKSKGIIK